MLKRLALCLLLSGCASHPVVIGRPPAADLVAVTEQKPKPTADILTSPAASDRFNSALESWGDRVHSAGVRLCRYFKDTGMDVACGE